MSTPLRPAETPELPENFATFTRDRLKKLDDAKKLTVRDDCILDREAYDQLRSLLHDHKNFTYDLHSLRSKYLDPKSSKVKPDQKKNLDKLPLKQLRDINEMIIPSEGPAEAWEIVKGHYKRLRDALLVKKGGEDALMDSIDPALARELRAAFYLDDTGKFTRSDTGDDGHFDAEKLDAILAKTDAFMETQEAAAFPHANIATALDAFDYFDFEPCWTALCDADPNLPELKRKARYSLNSTKHTAEQRSEALAAFEDRVKEIVDELTGEASDEPTGGDVVPAGTLHGSDAYVPPPAPRIKIPSAPPRRADHVDEPLPLPPAEDLLDEAPTEPQAGRIGRLSRSARKHWKKLLFPAVAAVGLAGYGTYEAVRTPKGDVKPVPVQGVPQDSVNVQRKGDTLVFTLKNVDRENVVFYVGIKEAKKSERVPLDALKYEGDTVTVDLTKMQDADLRDPKKVEVGVLIRGAKKEDDKWSEVVKP